MAALRGDEEVEDTQARKTRFLLRAVRAKLERLHEHHGRIRIRDAEIWREALSKIEERVNGDEP